MTLGDGALDDSRHRGDVGDIGVHAIPLLLGLVLHIDHAPLVQHCFEVKAAGFFLAEGLTPPRLQVDPQGGFVAPGQGVVLGDDHWLTLVGHDGVALLVITVGFPGELDFAKELDAPLVLGFLGSQIDDSIAPGKVQARGYRFEICSSVFSV